MAAPRRPGCAKRRRAGRCGSFVKNEVAILPREEIINDLFDLQAEALGDIVFVEKIHVYQRGAELSSGLFVQGDGPVQIRLGDFTPAKQHIAEQILRRVHGGGIDYVAPLEGYFFLSGGCFNFEYACLFSGSQKLQDIRKRDGF